MPHGLLDFAHADQQPGVEQERAGRGAGLLHERLDERQGMALLALLMKGARQAELEREIVRRQRERFAVFLLRLFAAIVGQQRVGQMLAKRDVSGRMTQRLAQGLDCVVTWRTRRLAWHGLKETAAEMAGQAGSNAGVGASWKCP